MSDCTDISELMQKYLAGEIPPSELNRLHDHCRSCPDCTRLMELHSELANAGDQLQDVTEDDFRTMRHNVMERISEETPAWASRKRWWDIGALLRSRPALFLPVAAVLVVVSVFAGRWTVSSPEPADVVFSDNNVLLREINQQATRQAGLIDYWDSPYSYSNVTARPLGDGNLDLGFDVCRHVNIVTPMNSPIASEVLLHAILDPSAMGSRMKAMELTSEILDPKLRDALIFTLHNDPNLAVRTEAMSVLGRHPYDQDIQAAMLATLRNDDEVQMRLLALEYLAGKHVNMDTIRRTIEETPQESNPALMQYASELITDTH